MKTINELRMHATNFVEVLCAKGVVTVSYWSDGRPDLVWRIEGEKAEHTVDVSGAPDHFIEVGSAYTGFVRRKHDDETHRLH